LDDEDECPVVRSNVAKTLGHLQKHASPAAQTLINSLEDSNAGVRASAANAIGQIPSAKEAIPALTFCLTDSDSNVVSAAVMSLGRFGALAATAAPALLTCLVEGNEVVRREAAVAIGAVGEPSVVDAGAVPVLTTCLRDSDVGVRQAAANALGRLYPHAGMAVQGLSDCFRDRDAEVRAAAVKALGQLNEHSTSVVPSIVNKALKDTCDEVRVQAATTLGHLHCLGHLGLHTDMVTTAMIERQKDACSRVRHAALVFSHSSWRKPISAMKKEKGSMSKGTAEKDLCTTWRRTEGQMNAIRQAYQSPPKCLGARPGASVS